MNCKQSRTKVFLGGTCNNSTGKMIDDNGAIWMKNLDDIISYINQYKNPEYYDKEDNYNRNDILRITLKNASMTDELYDFINSYKEVLNIKGIDCNREGNIIVIYCDTDSFESFIDKFSNIFYITFNRQKSTVDFEVDFEINKNRV